jgi:O-antigen/teichoic acid export membrane protein
MGIGEGFTQESHGIENKDQMASNGDISSKSQVIKELDSIEHLTKQIAKGGGIAFIGSVIGNIAGFGLHILLGRVLGSSAYGLYSLGASVWRIAQSVSSLGLNQGVVRFCAMYQGVGNKARLKGTIFSALVISLISSMLMGGILFALSGTIARELFRAPELAWILRFFGIALPFYVLMGITTSFAQAFRRIDYQQGVHNVFRPLVNFALVGLAFLLGFRLAGAVYGFLISGVLSAGLGFYFLWKLFPELVSISMTDHQSAQLLRFSVPVFFISISYLLATYTDRIMLGYFKKANDVGIYNAASATALQLTIFLGAIIGIFSPMVSDLYNKGIRKELKSLFTTVTKWVFTLTLPLFIILALFSKDIMLIFGIEFVSGWIVLVLLGFAQLINVGTGPVGILLQMTGKQDIDFVNGILLLCTNIGLNIWLIPLYGITGAGAATAVSLILIHTLRLIEVGKILKMTPYDKRYVKPIIASVVVLLLGTILKVYSFPSTQWVWISTSMILLLMAYIGILLGMGLDHEDKIILSAIKRKISCS